MHEYYILPINPAIYLYYLCFPIGAGCAFFLAKFEVSSLVGKILKRIYPLRELVALYLVFEGYRTALVYNYNP
jgi:hypothetical protein